MVAEAVLEAATVRLRPLTEDDLPLLVRWSNDPDVRHWLHRSERPPSTLQLEREFHAQRLRDPSSVDWCIETPDGGPIGVVRLRGIDEAHTRAELGVYIGEKACWGRGYGTDAIRRVLRFAFAELALRRVWLITDADNARGIRCYEKCGFVQEALLHGHRLRYGAPLDMLAMGVLREEFTRLGSEDGD
jgi:RimJ/RimL family protein N-acetyltransferase